MKISKLSLMVVVALALTACQTAPPPVVDTPPPEVVKPVEVKPIPVDGGTLQEALTDAEVQEVEAAIKAAEEADGAIFAPELLDKSKKDLEEAKKLGSTGNPNEGRKFLASALEAAKEALKVAKAGQVSRWIDLMNTSDQKALSVSTDKFLPENYVLASGKKAEAQTLLSTDYPGGKALSEDVLKQYSALIQELDEKTGEIDRIKKDITSRLAEAEALEAFIWVPETLEAANDAYFQGSNAYKKYNLSESLEAYTQARFLAGKAVQDSRSQKAKKETEDLMLETMRKIERASNLIIVDDKDNIQNPEPWDGSEHLKKTAPQPQSFLLPTDGTPLVLEEESRVTYLSMAKDLWFKGVDEKNLGNYPAANQYFLESQKYIRMYEALAVDKLYTVRLIPERRDALWRIAEYSSIYGDPLQWPLIWKRNKKLIQNPDLIFPGWQLIIPPK